LISRVTDCAESKVTFTLRAMLGPESKGATAAPGPARHPREYRPTTSAVRVHGGLLLLLRVHSRWLKRIVSRRSARSRPPAATTWTRQHRGPRSIQA
jgi:hypothetical protein